MLKPIRKLCKLEARGTLLTHEELLGQIRMGTYVPIYRDTPLERMRLDIIRMYISMETAYTQLSVRIDTMREDVKNLCGVVSVYTYDAIMRELRKVNMKNCKDVLTRTSDLIAECPCADLDPIAQSCESMIEEWSYHCTLYKTSMRVWKIAKKSKPRLQLHLMAMLQQSWYDCAQARVCMLQNATLMVDLKAARSLINQARITEASLRDQAAQTFTRKHIHGWVMMDEFA
jgi:hypothetical protein